MKASDVRKGMTLKIRGERVEITHARKTEGYPGKTVIRGTGPHGTSYFRVIDSGRDVGEQVK